MWMYYVKKFFLLPYAVANTIFIRNQTKTPIMNHILSQTNKWIDILNIKHIYLRILFTKSLILFNIFK